MPSILNDTSLAVIFAYSPTGLGHLRVTDALYHGLPENVNSVLIGSNDNFLRNSYRFLSRNSLARVLMEFSQVGFAEQLLASPTRKWLQKYNHKLYQQVVNVLNQRFVVAKTVLLVATHADLAHQIAGFKKKLEKEQGVKVFLVVQVTDDSPQALWYVPGANLTFVPSLVTKKSLEDFGKKKGFPAQKFEVVPYPVSPVLRMPLSKERFGYRIHQLNSESHSTIHVSVPISGAAVGTDFLNGLMISLNRVSKRINFHITCKNASFTHKFLHSIAGRSYIHLHAGIHDREVVDLYEKLFEKETISLEITKPSEQTFKALLNPNQLGGVVLLFSKPVGRQEYDNLDFLRRHKLLPSSEDQKKLLALAGQRLPFSKELFPDLPYWRSLLLPLKISEAQNFINWALSEGILFEMINIKAKHSISDREHHELETDGVEQFWNKVSDFLKVEIK